MIIWIIGMSAAGKSVVGKELFSLIKREHRHTILLDGDVFRGLHDNDLDHTLNGRKKNSDRICRMSHFLDQQGINVVCAVLSLFHEAQDWNRANYSDYFEVFLDVDFSTLVQRDPHGYYKKAMSGELVNFVGVDIPFPPPKSPNLVIKNDGSRSPQEIAEEIYEQIKLRL